MQEITRTVGETIVLGDDIQITILGIEGSQAIIGVRDLTGKLQLQKKLLVPDSGEEQDTRCNAPLISGSLLSGR